MPLPYPELTLKTKRIRTLSKNDILSIVVLSLVIGSFALSWVDKDIRATFADLAKVDVGGYIALLFPAESDQRR
ncbi:hypothetical protein H6F86_18445 [Phormidium sp. FACHB-592]|uniref:Uncharacterized protein n=1 Tax=Stenomitos frigidus AS-A4 TaxID=2933935 RepID=A0ABV0KRR2_9CYAN|nr:hypothetical protein [Phormidium sp. FACHB-592]MBD2075835.1 hypothetical protein [Phormidium sp. FACHB-592]